MSLVPLSHRRESGTVTLEQGCRELQSPALSPDTFWGCRGRSLPGGVRSVPACSLFLWPPQAARKGDLEELRCTVDLLEAIVRRDYDG